MSDFPAITGKELIRLLVKDGWEVKRKMTHGMGLVKYCLELDRLIVVNIPDKNIPLSKSTLGRILGPDQSRIGMEGLREIIARFE